MGFQQLSELGYLNPNRSVTGVRAFGERPGSIMARPPQSICTSATVSSRAPTSVELGCANPAQPCKLPNAMAGDPPLAPVAAKNLTVDLSLSANSSAIARGNETTAINPRAFVTWVQDVRPAIVSST